MVTGSQDGHVKFWKKQEEGMEFVKHFTSTSMRNRYRQPQQFLWDIHIPALILYNNIQ